MDRTHEDTNLSQIEYLLHQSTQGLHFVFDHADLVRILSRPTDEEKFFTSDNKEKVHDMLSRFLDRPTIIEKQSFLERLSPDEYELLIRAYFQLVENTILAATKLRH
jgi:ribosome maturation factor RimP